MRFVSVVVRLIVLAAMIVILGDFTHALIVHRRLAEWEAEIERNPEGVRKGCAEFNTGSGETVLLLIHGFADSPALYTKMAPRLAGQGFAVRAMRLPGFAMPMEKYKLTRLESWQDALVHEIDQLRESHDSVWLVGHSMGGALAIRHTLKDPDSVDGLVLIAPLAEVSRKRSPMFRPRTWFKLGTSLVTFSQITESYFPLDAHDPVVRETFPRDKFVPLVIYRDLFRLVRAIEGKGGDLEAPILTILSDQDRIIDAAAAERFVHLAGATNREVVKMNNAGHVIPWDFGWEEAADAIANFVKMHHNSL